MRVALLSILLLSVPTFASFDRSYEYRSFSDLELKIADYFNKMDSEYYSDVMVFSTTFRDEVRYQLSDKAVLASFGSLSRSEFLKDTRVKVRHAFSDQVHFQFLYFEQKDYDTLQSHSVFEFFYNPRPSLSLSVFTELGFEKATDNLGFAATYFFQPKHQLRLFFNNVQYDRNKRNTKDDQFLKVPKTYGYIGRYNTERYGQTEYLEYGLLVETPLTWDIPARDLTFDYKRWMGTLRYLRPLNPTDSITFLYQDDKRTERRTTRSSGVATDPFITHRHQLQTEFSTKKFHRFDWDVGLYTIKKEIDYQGANINVLDILPYTTLHFNRNPEAIGYWSFGYDIDFHSKETLHTVDAKNTREEHRANIYWTANLDEKSYLRFAFTLDTDDLSWEGGNGKFFMEF